MTAQTKRPTQRAERLDRVLIIVLDSVGVGDAPDANEFGDEGSNTLANTARAVGGLSLPHLERLGLGNLTTIEGVPPRADTQGAYGRMREVSRGKDTTTGHWELMGVPLDSPFPTYPNGFPPELIEAFEARIGRKVLGNRVASGTQIIEALGAEHVASGRPIVYTSADSVFQIAAHIDVISVDDLYAMCMLARELLVGKHAVGRVIARPFTGSPGEFVRTADRKDFSLEPPAPTLLDQAVGAGLQVHAIGKIVDIFAGRGVTHSTHTANNMEGVDQALAHLRGLNGRGIVFANCVDFDALWGHRNDPVGYARGLEAFDARVPELIAALGEHDALVIVADHGCDPTTPSTDHSRELVPLLICGPRIQPGVDLGVRPTFADLGATVADALHIVALEHGESFWPLIQRRE